MDATSLGQVSWTALLGLDLNQDQVVKELSVLFDQYCNHSEVLDAEVKYFLREFESRRGTEDSEALQALIRQRKSSNRIMDRLLGQSDVDLETLLLTLNAAENKINQMLKREPEFNKKAEVIVQRNTANFENDQVKYSKELEAYRDQIDTDTAEKAKEIEASFAIPEEIKLRMQKKREHYQQKEQEQTWFSKRVV